MAKRKTTTEDIPTTTEALRAMLQDYPAIELLTRQLESPGVGSTLPILLRDEDEKACVNSEHQYRLAPGATRCRTCGKPARKWYTRWINTAVEGRWSDIKARGYIPVEVSELRDAHEIADLTKAVSDTYVRKGDSGKEVLVKRPLAAHNAIKRKEQELYMRQVASKKAIQTSLATAASGELGDEAGQAIHDGAIQVESFTRHRTTYGDERGGAAAMES